MLIQFADALVFTKNLNYYIEKKIILINYIDLLWYIPNAP